MEMDIAGLAAFLAPLVPYLIKGGIEAGKAAAGALGKKAVEESWDGLDALWKRIRKKAEKKPAAQEAIQDAAAAPKDEDAQAALRQQLKKLLAEEPELADGLRVIAEKIETMNVAEAGGHRAVAGGTIRDSQVATGDGVIQVGGDLVQNYHPAPAGSAAAPDGPVDLRLAYLNHVFETTSQLQLSGIDPKTALDAEARLNLGAVYTALLTFSAQEHDAWQKAGPAEAERLMEREQRRCSALEELNRYPRLVLLGDPGGGKSTFVNFVAMCLAGEALGHAGANLAALTAPLPEDGEDDRLRRSQKEEQPRPQPWEHGALIPVRVLLRDFAARGLPPVGQEASAKTLWDFIAAELEKRALGGFAGPLEVELRREGGLLLLDGLDEVPEADRRRVQIKQAVDDFALAFRKCRILVTSRTYAYQKQDWRLRNNFAESVLAPFSRGQVRSFVDRWYAHIAVLRSRDPEEAQGNAELLKRAIFSSARLQELAERPLLLTLMASLHAWRGGTLPEKREELYADAVELLLDSWESPKVVRDGRGEIVMSQPSLAEWLKVDRQKVRTLLEELAFRAHAAQAELTGTADIAEGDLVSGLMRLSQNPEVNPRQLVDYLSLRAGLLIPRGVGVYTFPHRTFQEYLAACHLTDHDYPDRVAELACGDINRWREVALLAGAKAARGTAAAIWSLVDALCYAEVAPGCAIEQQWGTLLAAQALTESGSQNNVSERNLPKKERVRNGLVTVLEAGRLPAVERAAAGDALARLGDPRPGVNANDFLWCPVPAGEFLMGSKSKEDDALAYSDEFPQFLYKIRQPFYIARYPVTNAQFEAFLEDPQGYSSKKWWSKDGWEWRKNEERERPPKQGGGFDLPNHPVVNLAWYEAYAFTRWLGARLTAQSFTLPVWKEGRIETVQLKAGVWQVRLPSEAEWERAARGIDGRRYPWGHDPDPNRANYADTGLGATSAAGCFPGGASPCGALDMSGNVWEWCATAWTENYEGYDKSEDNASEGKSPRVLRGGAFYYVVGSARCVFRGRGVPHNWNRNQGFRLVVAHDFPGCRNCGAGKRNGFHRRGSKNGAACSWPTPP